MAEASAAYPDIQTKGTQLDPNVSIQGYTYEKLLEYWTMIYTLGLLAGVAGSETEQKAAKQAVLDAVDGAVQEASSLLDAAATAADDYSPPFIGAAVLGARRGGLTAVQNVGEYFGYKPGLKDDIENLDQRIRDSVRVDINQVSQASKAGKAAVQGISQATGIGDYKADTSAEDRVIQATQGTVDARQAQIEAALNKIWNGIKGIALERYNRFISDWEKGGLNYAIGTLGVDAAFLALEVAIGVAAGLVTGGAGAVVLKVAVSIGKRVSKTATRAIRVAFKRGGGGGGKTGSFGVSEGSVVKHAKEKNGFGDDHAGVPKSTHKNEKDPGGPDGDSDGKNGKKEDQRKDGSYRNPNDPPGVRRDANGEAMVQNSKTGEWGKISSASNNAKGNFGETMADRHMASQGYTKLNGPNTQIGDGIDKGIDGVYHNPNGNPPYVIADAKYGTAGLGKVKGDIKQMSPAWIRDRLEGAVGLSNARKIEMQGHSSRILKIDKKGNVVEKSLDDMKWRDHEK